MKKIITFCILLSAFCILLASCFSKCEHTYDNSCDVTCNKCGEGRNVESHDYIEADCDTPRTCKLCGYTDGAPRGHNFADATCVLPKTCTACNATEGTSLGHAMTTPDVDQCEVQSTCSRCGLTEGKNIEHTYDNACDASCNNCGKERMTEHIAEVDDGNCTTAVLCSICEAVVIPAKTEHTPGADDNDCTTAICCSSCGMVTTEAKTHDFTDVWHKDANGHWHVCKNDGCLAVDTKVGHISDGAATEDKAEKCSICEYVITPELDHVHKYNILRFDETSHWHECACGEHDTDIALHSAKDDDGDCTTAVVCKVCEYVVINAKSAHEAEDDDRDCTTAIKCKHCDKIAVAPNESHAPAIDDGDCTTAINCTICGKVITAAADSHVAAADDGDCTTPVKCTNCEKIAIVAKEHTPEADDGDCTTEIKCSECGKTVVSGANEHIDNDGDYICDSDGCVVVVPGDPDDGDGSVDLPTIPY